MSKKKKHGQIDPDEFKRYPAGDFTFIPLFRWNATEDANGKPANGKRPLNTLWSTATYDSAKVRARCIHENRNAGIRLKPDQLHPRRPSGRRSCERSVRRSRHPAALLPLQHRSV
jgi:hypothetical protein